MSATLVQRDLPLRVPLHVTLVSLDVARAVLGIDAESVSAQLDSGTVRWAWDFSMPGTRRREVRFWVAELRGTPGGEVYTPLDQVIAAVIGTTPNQRQRAAVMEVRWGVSAQLTTALVRAKIWAEDRVGHTRFLRRENLERFLEQRLIK